MTNFGSFSGTITGMHDYSISANEEFPGCYKIMSLQSKDGSIVNFVVGPATYFVDHVTAAVGDTFTGYYDANMPVPYIYPPQYRAIVMVKSTPFYDVKVDYFDTQLVSSDGQLKLNLASNTPIVLRNNQLFTMNPANRDLVVVYGPTTRSIPAQTTPYKIIVLCYGNIKKMQPSATSLRGI